MAEITRIFTYKTAYIGKTDNVRVTVNVLPMCINNTLPVKLILFSERFESSRAVFSQQELRGRKQLYKSL